MKTKKSRKKNYIARVNGALFRHLIGRKINDLKEVKVRNSENKFYFFTNSNKDYDPEEILKKLKGYVKKSGNICFGVFQMKNHKEYYFICELDTLYINENLTHIHTKPVVNFSGRTT
jgi:hypothetical protein